VNSTVRSGVFEKERSGVGCWKGVCLGGVSEGILGYARVSVSVWVSLETGGGRSRCGLVRGLEGDEDDVASYSSSLRRSEIFRFAEVMLVSYHD